MKQNLIITVVIQCANVTYLTYNNHGKKNFKHTVSNNIIITNLRLGCCK